MPKAEAEARIAEMLSIIKLPEFGDRYPYQLSGAFLTFAIVIGEFTMASLLNRPAFGPYLQNIGANRAYEPAALAIIAFAITWGCMSIIQVLSRFAPRSSNRPN